MRKIDVSINGKWLSEVVPGFWLMSIEGRELLSKELKTHSITGVDGVNVQTSYRPARKLKLKYWIDEPINTVKGDKYNKLASFLNVNQAQIIFSDERDKYFIGTPEDSDEESITIYCSDPYKYSTTEKAFSMGDDKTITIENGGSVPCPIRYQIYHGTHDNGYIGIASDEGAMEFGKREEIDGKSYTQNESLVHMTDFFNGKDDGKSASDHLNASHSTYDVTGSLEKQTWDEGDFLILKAPAVNTHYMNGGSRTITIPADSNGVRGAKDFYCWHRVITWAGLIGQTGELTLNFLTEDDESICAYNWYKNDTSGNKGHYEFWLHGNMVESHEYTWNNVDSQNPYSMNRGPNDIQKIGDKVQFYWWGHYPTYSDPAIRDLVCSKIQITIKQYGARSGDQYVSKLGIGQLTFQKLGVSGYKDIPNRYLPHALCIADGNDGTYTVNGQPKPNDEVLGTEYFQAPVGSLKVQMNFSSFCKPLPTVKAYIRERWL